MVETESKETRRALERFQAKLRGRETKKHVFLREATRLYYTAGSTGFDGKKKRGKFREATTEDEGKKRRND